MEHPIVLAFTEHWLHPSEEKCIQIEGYTLASYYTRNTTTHGGCCIYIRRNYDFQNIEAIRQITTDFDMECCGITIHSRKLIVLCIYRSMNSNKQIFFTKLQEVMHMLRHKLSYKIILCGDFNFNLLTQSADISAFIDILNSFNLVQTIFTPTRTTGTSKSLLDNFFVNCPNSCKGSVVETALSDHSGQRLCVVTEIEIKRPPQRKLEYITAYNLEKLTGALMQESWTELTQIREVNEAFDHFMGIIQYHYKRFCSQKITGKSKRPNYGWITNGIRISSERKRELYQDYINNRIERNTYITYRRILRNVIAEAKRLHNNQYIMTARNKTAATWSLIKKYSGNETKKSFDIRDFKHTGESTQTILNQTNNFLINTCPNITTGITHNYPTRTHHRSMFIQPTDVIEIKNIIYNLKDTKSIGPDGIPMCVIKKSAEVLLTPLAYLVNLTISTGVFPDKLKHADVTLLHKKGDRKDLHNYRPISILPCFSKIFETILVSRIYKYLESNQLIDQAHSGFIKNRSTNRAIFQSISGIIQGLSEKQKTAGMFVDLTKAFDSISHKVLYAKLEHIGIRGLALTLLQSYLSKRKQRIKILDEETGYNIFSDYLETERGIPQGTIIGPILYIIYTNDLPFYCSSPQTRHILFADDTSLITQGNTIQNLKSNITDNMNKLKQYFNCNSLQLNPAKTQLIYFSLNPLESPLTIEIDGHTIQSKNSTKFLGIQLDSRLDWKAHINMLAGSLSSFCYALWAISNHVNLQATLSAYYAYIDSRIRYGIIFWGNSVEAPRIFTLQKRAVRTMFNISRRETCRNTFRDYKILTLPGIYIIECVVFIKKHYNFFIECEGSHQYNTRRNNLRPPFTHFTGIQKNALHQIIKIYNYLPPEWKELNLAPLKKRLFRTLCDRPLYSVEDFFTTVFP